MRAVLLLASSLLIAADAPPFEMEPVQVQTDLPVADDPLAYVSETVLHAIAQADSAQTFAGSRDPNGAPGAYGVVGLEVVALGEALTNDSLEQFRLSLWDNRNYSSVSMQRFSAINTLEASGGEAPARPPPTPSLPVAVLGVAFASDPPAVVLFDSDLHSVRFFSPGRRGRARTRPDAFLNHAQAWFGEPWPVVREGVQQHAVDPESPHN